MRACVRARVRVCVCVLELATQTNLNRILYSNIHYQYCNIRNVYYRFLVLAVHNGTQVYVPAILHFIRPKTEVTQPYLREPAFFHGVLLLIIFSYKAAQDRNLLA